MKCAVDKYGNYTVEILPDVTFNLHEIVNELLEKASSFDEGDNLVCLGRNVSKAER